MNRVVSGLSCAQWVAAFFVLGTALLSQNAKAQDIPDSVATDVATSEEAPAGEAEFSEAPTLKEEPPPPPPMCPCPEEPPPPDPNALKKSWTLSAGGAFNTGNAQSWIVNAGTNLKLEKKSHVFTANGAFSYGQANVPDDMPDVGLSTTVKQLLLGARYDYFFTDKDAMWIAVGERWDPIAGFDTQFRLEAGYLRAFIKEDDHYFAGRIGYSFTYENYSDRAAAAGDETIHGLLAALDYENKLNENVTFLTGLTTIFNLNSIDIPRDAGAFEDIRVYWYAGILAQLMEKLAIELRFNLLYDRIPAAPKKVDTTTTVSLVYTAF